MIESYIYKGGGDFINNNNNENSSVSIKSTEARERVKEIEGSLGFGLTMKKEVETMAETKKKEKFNQKKRDGREVRVSNAQTRLYILLYTYKVGANAHVITRLKRQIAKKNHMKRGGEGSFEGEECIHVQVATFFLLKR